MRTVNKIEVKFPFCILFYKMETRSKTIQNREPKYTVEIDFDKASEMWKENKISQGNGTYRYCCMGKTRTGEKCSCKRIAETEYCKKHTKK